MRKYLFIILLVLPLAGLRAETEEHMAANPHEFRLGMGESLLGSLFHFVCRDPEGPWMYAHYCHTNGLSTSQVHDHLSRTYITPYNNVAWAPHVFGEYMYRVNRWFGVGVQTDFYVSSRRYVEQNGYGDRLGDHYQAEMCWAIMPVFRFTYYRSEWVSLYSHIGLGYSGDFGLTDHKLDYSTHLPAFGATFLGVSVGRDHWFGTFELGSMSTVANFRFMDRLFSLSAGYRF